MQWVETTGRTLDEATAAALERLGVDERDAEVEVLEEPRPGLFGRMRGEARVRARVRPTQARPKVERRDRKRRRDGDESPVAAGVYTSSASPESPRAAAVTNGDPEVPSGDELAAPAAPRRSPRQEPSMDAAPTITDEEPTFDATSSFLQGLVSAFGLDGSVVVVRTGADDVELQVDGDDLGLLIGPRGQTLATVQELTRIVALHHDEGAGVRLHVDVAGYRARRREALAAFALRVAEEVVATGTARALEPMTSADRKVVHDTLSSVAGVRTVSEGEDPARRVVVLPADA